MDDIKTQVDEFIALPKKERKEKYMALPKTVRLRVREELEKRRGIAFRKDGGIMVLSKEAYIEQLTRMARKKNIVLPERINTLGGRISEMKKKLQADWGDDALAEAEEALDNVK